MRDVFSDMVEDSRLAVGPWATAPHSSYGTFFLEHPKTKRTLQVFVCDGQETGWDHVSVSLGNRCPNWEEMSFVKDCFWDGNETVVQFHPKKDEYINNHPYCLHMWKPTKAEIQLPPEILVGINRHE